MKPSERAREAPTYAACRASLSHATGIIIPVYLPDNGNREQGGSLLRDTVVAACVEVSDPSVICLSVDGEESGVEIVEDLRRAFGVTTAVSPVNRGKLHGVRQGAQVLLERPELAYVAVMDADSDHFANELLTFVRTAAHIVWQTQDPRVMVLGRRISRHRPMGLLRGELEDLADQILVLALQYHAAVSDRPLRFEYATLLEATPDFHSGYKLFSRVTAADVFLSAPQQAGLSDTAYYRHAVEAVMAVEAILSGARLGVVNRTTHNQQPVTTFGLLDQAEVTGDMIAWPCKRLGVPVTFVRQWLANTVSSLLLDTLVPEGRSQLEAVCRTALAAYGEAFAPDLIQRKPPFV
ncbi:MAG: hypothetical protein JXC32_17260 [Anaerolineae bacterium]|nr:hypothetical protein [Anaerolineae bacterium]